MSECTKCPTHETLMEISRQIGELQGLMAEARKDQQGIWQEIVQIKRDVDEAKSKLENLGDPRAVRDSADLIAKVRKRIIAISSAVGILSFASGTANADHIKQVLQAVLELLK